MRRVYIAFGLLAALIIAVVGHSFWIGSSVRSIRDAMTADKSRSLVYYDDWKELRRYLEWSVKSAELDLIEDDLAHLKKMDENDPELEMVVERLSRSLERIYYEFVPSFTGVF